jgi:hypothetical protein
MFLLIIMQIAAVYLYLFGLIAFFKRQNLSDEFAAAAGLAVFGVFAITLFWIAMILLPDQDIAYVLKTIACFALLFLAAVGLINGQWRDSYVMPLALGAIGSVLLTLWVQGSDNPLSILRIAARKWLPLPSDNEIPYIFARAILRGDLPQWIMGDWTLSDRPPLQSAMILVTPAFLVFLVYPLAYQAASVALQLFAALGIWIVVRVMGGSQKLALISIIAVLVTPLGIVHGAYVWPKLLSASFLCAAFALYFHPGSVSGPKDWRYGAVIGVLLALAMLSHGGAAFPIIGGSVAAVALRRSSRPAAGSKRRLVALALAFFAAYAPWLGYQKFVNPPGDRLVKWHLAGAVPLTSKPFGEVFVEAYSQLSFQEWLDSKQQNITMLGKDFVPVWSATLDALSSTMAGHDEEASQTLKNVRKKQFFGSASAIGLLGFSLFLLPLFALNIQQRALALTLLASFAIWIALMFVPNSTVVHHGSLFMQIGVALVGIVWLGTRERFGLPMATGVAVLQASITLFQYSL